MNFNEVCPQLSKDVHIKHVEKDKYILSQRKYKYQFYINSRTKKLLELVDGKNSITDITKKYNQSSGINLADDEVYNLLYTKFPEKGIILTDKQRPIVARKSASYLTLRLDLIKSSWLQWLKKFTNPFFKPKAFLTIFIAGLGYLLGMFFLETLWFYEKPQPIENINLSSVLLYILTTSVIHELGHALAVTSYGLKAGNIGFGFYLFSPVLYTDVSEVWALPLKKRILVNLAGMYAETIFLVLLSILPQMQAIIPHLIVIYFARLLINSIPFLRFDGYWILSDITGYPNLNSKGAKHFVMILKAFLTGKIKQVKFQAFLFFYGMINLLMIILFLVLIISMIESFINFPTKLYQFINGDITLKNITAGIFVYEYFFPLAFYFITIKWLLEQALKYTKRLKFK